MPGFLLGRRYEAVSGQPRYFNFYLTQSAERAEIGGLSRASRSSDADDAHDHVGDFQGHDPHRLPPHAAARRDARTRRRLRLRFMEQVDQTALKAAIEELIEGQGVACGEIWSAVSASEFPVSEEERLRGGDRKIEACLYVETLRVRMAEQDRAATLARQFPSAAVRRLSAAVRDQAGLSVRLPPSRRGFRRAARRSR